MREPIQLHVEGMSCGGCVARVESALRSVSGVTDATVNLTTEIATVHTSAAGLPGQRLVDAVRSIGYDGHMLRRAGRTLNPIERGHEQKLREQRQSFVHALSAGVPIMALHGLGGVLQSSQAGGHVWPTAIQAILCTVLLVSPGGAPILAGGFRAVVHRTPNMDLLVALGVTVAYASSLVWLLSGSSEPTHFHVAAMILCFINLGRYYELRARRDAASAVTDVAGRLPHEVLVMEDGEPVPRRLELVRVGDLISVADGLVVPVDGEVAEGRALVDQSAVTGESMPVEVGPGQQVYSGSVVCDGLVRIKALRVGADATFGRILQAVEQAQSGKTTWQRIADRIAGIFAPIVLVISLVALVVNLGMGVGWSVALSRAISVLVIACPCAMGLATPTAIMVAAGVAARLGILIRDAAAWERAASVDLLLLDKTGTLTTGRPVVTSAIDDPASDATGSADEVLSWVASAEQYAQHPIASAIVAAAKSRNLPLFEVKTYRLIPGGGCEATVARREVLVGSASFLKSHDVNVERVADRARQLSHDGQTIVYLAIDRECAGLLSLSDTVKETAADAVAALRRLKVDVVMLTGDRATVAASVAGKVGIESVEAELSPEGKLAAVDAHKKAGRCVGVIGDGVNDAPALASADVGITFSDAADLAIGAADVTIVGGRLDRVPTAIALSRRTVAIIKQNLFWAFLYNTAALPLAATGHIHPGLAAAAMMLSSLSVVFNSLRLRKGA